MRERPDYREIDKKSKSQEDFFDAMRWPKFRLPSRPGGGGILRLVRPFLATGLLFLGGEILFRVFRDAPPSLSAGQRYLYIESGEKFFDKERRDGIVWCVGRQKLLQKPSDFPLAKPEGTLRVFVVGESVAAHPANTVALEKILQAILPDRKVRVINCGTPGYRIHQWLPVAMEVLQYQPDILIAMTGNNEIGPPDPWLDVIVRWRERLKRSRLLWSCLAAIDGLRRTVAWRFGLLLTDSSEGAAANVERYYRIRLGRLIAECRARKCLLVLCPLPVNLKDCAPKASVPDDWENFQEGFCEMSAGRFHSAVNRFKSVLVRQPSHLLTHFYLAKCYEGMGNLSHAKKHYAIAQSLDTARRCPPFIIDLLRKQKGQNGIVVADLLSAFEGEAGDVPLGREFFIDECHWWPEFYELAAWTIARAIYPEESGDRRVTVSDQMAGVWRGGHGRMEYASFYPGETHVLNKVIESLPSRKAPGRWFGERAVQQLITFIDRYGEDAIRILRSEDEVNAAYRQWPWQRPEDPDLTMLSGHAAEALRRMGRLREAREALGRINQGLPAPFLLTRGLLFLATNRPTDGQRDLAAHRAFLAVSAPVGR